MGIAGAIAGGTAVAGLAGAAMTSSAAGSAADQQSASAGAASAQQAAQYQQTRNDLMPYNTTGQNALSSINNNLAGYGTPDQTYINAANQNLTYQSFNADKAQKLYDSAAQIGSGPNGQAALEATPGYQFTLSQGLQSAQNSAAARGLGVSGAAMKGAATYATGLADNTYQQQYNNAMGNAAAAQSTGNMYGNIATQDLNLNTANQGNITNSYNKLLGTAQLGENAASMTGSLGQQSAAAQSALITGSGNAQAAGTVGSANALSSGLTGAASGGSNAYYMNQLLSQNAGNTSAYTPLSQGQINLGGSY